MLLLKSLLAVTSASRTNAHMMMMMPARRCWWHSSSPAFTNNATAAGAAGAASASASPNNHHLLQHVSVSRSPSARVAIVELDRPKALNALSSPLFAELATVMAQLEADPTVGAIVLASTSPKAFAAGADIREMVKKPSFDACFADDFLASWGSALGIARRKPLIAAVRGYALGGGCELAMMCDIVYAGESAVFGQPECRLGVPPGAGGTQRLPRAIGKSRAMEMVLSGCQVTAGEAAAWGLVSRVYPDTDVLARAVALGDRICENSPTAVAMAKELINGAFETGLSSGLLHERRMFHAAFSTGDRAEGMQAFVEKRAPKFEAREPKEKN